MLVPEEVVAEFQRAVSTKKYLAERITAEDAQELMSGIIQVAEIIPAIEAAIPPLAIVSHGTRSCARGVQNDYLEETRIMILKLMLSS